MGLIGALSLAGVCLLGAMSPGPSLAVVVAQTLRGGARYGMLAALAHGFGVALYALAVVSGLAALIAGSPLLFALVQYAGAAFLLYLGIRSLASRGGARLDTPAENLEPEAGKAMLEGFAVAFLNPKLAVFFLALFSQFLSPSTTLLDKALMVFIAGSVDAGWYLLVSLLLGQAKILERLRRREQAIDRAFGVILVVLACSIVLRA